MTEVLLKELSNSDINWMIDSGRQYEITAGSLLIRPGQPHDALHVVLDGTLIVAAPQPEADPLASAFSALENRDGGEREIARLSNGEIIGEVGLLGLRPPAIAVKATERTLILSIARRELEKKLQNDLTFAAHFYRAIAILLADRLHDIVNQLGYSRFAQSSPMREILFIFGELSDSDIDWMVAVGHQEVIPAGTTIVQQSRPVDGLYILLDGKITVFASEAEANPLAVVFAGIEENENEIAGREIARLFRGDIFGETIFVSDRPPAMTIKALDDCRVLIIPRQQVAVKLEQDMVFASHFYRMMAILLSHRLRDLLGRVGYGRRVYHNGQTLNASMEYEDELELDVIDRTDLARARFDWMLKRMQRLGTR